MKAEIFKRNSLDQPHVAAAAPVYIQPQGYDEWGRWTDNGEEWQDDWSYGDEPETYQGRPKSTNPTATSSTDHPVVLPVPVGKKQPPPKLPQSAKALPPQPLRPGLQPQKAPPPVSRPHKQPPPPCPGRTWDEQVCRGDLTYGQIAKKAPPLGSPPYPKVIVKAVIATAVLPKVHGISVGYYEINISDYPMLPWYYVIIFAISVLVLLLALLKVRDLILDHEWSARCLSWCGRPRYKFPYRKCHEFLKEWDRVSALLDNAENEVTAGESRTMFREEVADSIEQDLPTPEQLVNIFIVGSIDGSTKLHVVPECRDWC